MEKGEEEDKGEESHDIRQHESNQNVLHTCMKLSKYKLSQHKVIYIFDCVAKGINWYGRI